MHLLQDVHDAHLLAGGNGLGLDSLDVLSKTVDFPKISNGSASEAPSTTADLSDLSLLVAWLLFLTKHKGDDVAQFDFDWGYRSAGGPDIPLPLPSAAWDGTSLPVEPTSNGSVSDYIRMVDGLRRQDVGTRPTLGDYETIFLCELAMPLTSNLTSNANELDTKVSHRKGGGRR